MKKIALLLLVIVTISCGVKEESKPAGLIPEKEFTELLLDIQLLEGAYSTRFPRVDTSGVRISSHYQKVLQKHGVSGDQYRMSYEYYAARPEQMVKIEEVLLEKLSSMQATLEEQKAQEQVADTIRQE